MQADVEDLMHSTGDLAAVPLLVAVIFNAAAALRIIANSSELRADPAAENSSQLCSSAGGGTWGTLRALQP